MEENLVELLMLKQKSHESLVTVFYTSCTFKTGRLCLHYCKTWNWDSWSLPGPKSPRTFRKLQYKGKLNLSAKENSEKAEGS